MTDAPPSTREAGRLIDRRPAAGYLDHAATTPMVAQVVAEYTEQLLRTGNASSLHGAGRRARQVVEESRERLAQALGARPSEVVFTAGGTESDNLAVKGLFWARRAVDPRRRRVLASAVEHHAVLDAVGWLVEHEGAAVEWLPVDSEGRVHPGDLSDAIDRDPDDVALVTVMWVNNEVGTVQPVAELAQVARDRGIPFHTDAVQAVGQVPVDFAASGVDALTLTGHKLGGPLGVGALLVGRTVGVTPLLHGGGQERDIRSGTLDTPGIAALALAAELAVAGRLEKAARIAALRDDLVRRVLEQVPDAVLNGPPLDDPTADGVQRQPGNAHLSFPGCEGDALLMLLDAQGVECSTGSACSAGVARPSHVLLAMGAEVDLARASLRLTLGHSSTGDEVDRFVDAIAPAVARARRARA